MVPFSTSATRVSGPAALITSTLDMGRVLVRGRPEPVRAGTRLHARNAGDGSHPMRADATAALSKIARGGFLAPGARHGGPVDNCRRTASARGTHLRRPTMAPA